MSRQYKNFVRKLEPYNATMITTEKEYLKMKKKEFTFRCQNDHTSNFATASLANKLYKLDKEESKDICAECAKPESNEEIKAKNACENLGFKFISFSDRKVTYICICSSENNTYACNLFNNDRQAQCAKCQNNKNRHKLEDVRQIFITGGCELLETEYKNRHAPMKYICECGDVAFIRLGEFTQGKRCRENCKTRKYIETCQREYGVDNVFQLEEIKEKSRQTSLERYGVEYPMQNPEIFSKQMASSFKRKEYTAFDDTTWSVLGYEHFCLHDLIEQGVKTKHIKAGEDPEIPVVDYEFNGKRKWFPDVWIDNEELLIEVKSTFTYNKEPEKMRAKMEASPFNCELWVYSPKGEIIEQVSRNKNGEIDYLIGDVMVLGEKM